MKLLAIPAVLALAACASSPGKPDPKIVTKEVKVEVVRPCVTDAVPQPPAYADAGITTATDPVDRMTRRAAANEQRKARLAVLEPVVQACR